MTPFAFSPLPGLVWRRLHPPHLISSFFFSYPPTRKLRLCSVCVRYRLGGDVRWKENSRIPTAKCVFLCRWWLSTAGRARQEGGSIFFVCLCLGGYQTIPALQKTRMNERKKKGEKKSGRGKEKIQARKQHMAGMETWTGWMDGLFFHLLLAIYNCCYY